MCETTRLADPISYQARPCSFSSSPLDELQETAANCSWTWGASLLQISTAITGRFVDENGDKNSAVGETVTFNISVLNDGKVLLSYWTASFRLLPKAAQTLSLLQN